MLAFKRALRSGVACFCGPECRRWGAGLVGARKYGAAAVLLFGLGGMGTEPGTLILNEAGKFLWSLEPLQPAWLLLLLLIPVIVWLSFRSLAGLGPIRRWVAIGLRCLLMILLILA